MTVRVAEKRMLERVRETIDDTSELIGLEKISNRAYRNQGDYFVKSARQAGRFYRIRDGICSCPGFMFKHDCNHVQHLESIGYLERDDDQHGYGHRVTEKAREPYQPICGWRRHMKPDEF